MTLQPQDMDENITQVAFEIAIKRLYGTNIRLKNEEDAIHLFATALWLGMDDLVEQCVEFMVRQLTTLNLAKFIQLVTDNDYGTAGIRVLSCAKAILYKVGWEMSLSCWNGIPAEIVKDVIGGDAFYIPSEWERWCLAAKLLNSSLKVHATELEIISETGVVLEQKPLGLDTTTLLLSQFSGPWASLYLSAQIVPLLALLHKHIHYVHLQFEHLHFIKNARDILDMPFVPESIVSNAMWMQMQLRQNVINCQDIDNELDFTIEEEVPDDEEGQEDNSDNF
ncbi:hypothetical protein LTR66_017356, partial [Elasticomyces elasticus]